MNQARVTLGFQSDNGHSTKGTLVVYSPDNTTAIHADHLDIANDKQRSAFVKRLAEKYSGLPPESIEEAILQEVARIAEDEPHPDHKKNLSDILIEMADDCELFHDEKSEAYATIKVASHFETWPIRSSMFRLWLRNRLWQAHAKTATRDVLQTAIENIEARAMFSSPELPVYVRLAKAGNEIWLDLGDAEWRSVRITATGWQVVVGKPGVKFIRPRGLKPLPEPKTGGNIESLREFINVHDGDFILVLSWLLACLNPEGPYPILCLYGEQGSAKSTACRLLRSLIDPNSADLRAGPREGRDLVISASNAWILCFDNLSYIPSWMSDAFCRLSTGGGFATRQLYTDKEETIFDSMRPLALNGISDIVSRSDLLDRALRIMLPAIPAHERKTEHHLRTAFEEKRPYILGVLLDAVSTGLANLPHTELNILPRMADFARWVVACEPALGCEPGTFLRAYTQSRQQDNLLAVEYSLVGPALLSFMEARESWQGTYKELLNELEQHVGEKTSNRKDWPSSARKLSADLRRITPNLRAEGINVIEQGRTRHGSLVLIEKTPQTLSQPSPSSPSASKCSFESRLDGDSRGDELLPQQQRVATSSASNGPVNQVCDEGEHCDDLLQDSVGEEIDENPDVSDDEIDPRAWAAIQDQPMPGVDDDYEF